MVRIFSFGERWSVPFNSADASLNGTFHLSPHENILTIALINIHYLYNIGPFYLFASKYMTSTYNEKNEHYFLTLITAGRPPSAAPWCLVKPIYR
jgi:hypothetical protein